MATSLMTAPASARFSQGPRSPSWSNWVMTTSSPLLISRDKARLRLKARVVMLAPKEISRQDGAPRNAATASRVSCSIWSVSWDVMNSQ